MPLSDHALAYAAAGWPVFPVSMASKRPRTTHGHLDATTDERQVRAWAPLFNRGGGIATPTGNGLLVIDIDPRNGGRRPEWAPPTREVKTQSGGTHLHYKLSEDIISKAGLFGPGVDSKSAGGYVLIPPSPGYEWVNQGPRTVLLKPVVESHIVPGVVNADGSTARLAPDRWERGIIHDQAVAWAAYFAGELDEEEDVYAAVWEIVEQARRSGTRIDNARDHINGAIRWVLNREASTNSSQDTSRPNLA